MNLWLTLTLALACLSGGLVLWSLGGRGAAQAGEGEGEQLPPEVISSIRELQLDHQTGKLTQVEFEEARQSLLSELPRLLSQQQANAAPQSPGGVGMKGALLMVLLASVLALGAAWSQEQKKNQLKTQSHRALAAQIKEMQEQSGTPPEVMAMVDRLKNRLKKKPDDLPGQLMLGRSLLQLGDMQGAMDAYLAASKLDQDNAEALWGLGMVLLASGKPTDAAVALDASLERDPDYEESLYLRALLYADEEKRPDLALPLARRLVKIIQARGAAGPGDGQKLQKAREFVTQLQKSAASAAQEK